jgi:hypothetical protein
MNIHRMLVDKKVLSALSTVYVYFLTFYQFWRTQPILRTSYRSNHRTYSHGILVHYIASVLKNIWISSNWILKVTVEHFRASESSSWPPNYFWFYVFGRFYIILVPTSIPAVQISRILLRECTCFIRKIVWQQLSNSFSFTDKSNFSQHFHKN